MKKMESQPAENMEGDENDVVITGMAGLYPMARYIKDLENILYNKINPVSSDGIRFNTDHPELSQYMGNVPDLDRFDAQYFKVHYRLAVNMDAVSRKLLELTYEAIYDSGMSPQYLNGKKIAVYMASSFSETERGLCYCTWKRVGFGVVGCNRSMYASRISYWLNLTGPSMAIEQACCGSAAALTAAYNAIAKGECEGAIIGGGFPCLHPQSIVQNSRAIKMCNDGKTRSLSEDAAGCAVSEAMNVLFLQRAKNAKRIYATVVHAKSDYLLTSSKPDVKFGFYRIPSDTAKFLKTFYNEAGVQPSQVEYVEAFGSADPEADKSELEAIEEVFCTGRENPLLVGSVMSNIGYTELASGLSSVIKVLLGYHKGVLAGNLYCSAPRKDIKAIQEGRMQVLTGHRPFQRTYAAVNNMSLSGVNAHILLKGYYKPKNLDQFKTDLPRLITISARHEKAVEKVCDILKSNPIDPEQIALLYNIHEENVPGNLGKGYIILESSPSGFIKTLVQKAQYSDAAQRPLWFVYSGVGSQWLGMGAQLMKIPIFADSIQRCSKVLEPIGINIIDIITSSDPTTFDNMINTFVGIAAIQVALTDVLFELGIVPDKMIGHSAGELACGYADGCLSVEEVMLSAYSRGRVSVETTFIPGAMAAVGMGAQQIREPMSIIRWRIDLGKLIIVINPDSQISLIIPAELEVACHNSADCCTIAGPAEILRDFIATMSAKGIFAKEVACANIPYHSRYVAPAGPTLLKYLKEVIKDPKPRSERWISSSVPQDKWEQPEAKYCSAEYVTNNLLNPVLFEEASALIPATAVAVEIAPHGLLQAILKRSLPKSVTNIALTRRGVSENVTMLLESIGELYLQGFNPKLRVLYPEVKFPVSTETPLLSHFVDWAHEECWPLALCPTNFKVMTSCCSFVATIHGDNEYLRGYVIQNKIYVPPSYILVVVWDTLAMSLNLPKKSFNVEFSDVVFYAQPTLMEQKAVTLSVSLHRGSGLFEVMGENTKVATGVIIRPEKPDFVSMNNTDTCNIDLMYSDVYQILHDRGYSYSGEFRSIYCADAAISKGKVLWNSNWVTFIDALLQLNLLKFTSNGIVRPVHIGKLLINIQNHFKDIHIQEKEHNNPIIYIDTELSAIANKTTTKGVLVEDVHFSDILQINKEQVTLQPIEYIPKARGIEEEVLDTNQKDGSPLEDEPVNDEAVNDKDVNNKDVNDKDIIVAAVNDKDVNVEDVNDEDVLFESAIVRHWKSLKWVPELSEPEGTVAVSVHYAGVNIGDVRHALGLNLHTISESRNGIDYSGITERGDRVMGIALRGTPSTQIRTESELTWRVPEYWTLEEAATIPAAYLFAYYCLSIKVNMPIISYAGRKINILIHNGTSALGQAAINIALARGWRVFTTVRDLDKRRLILQLFPTLKENEIGCSCDSSFRELVLCATNGKGCNIVVCNIRGELKNCSLSCVGHAGVLIDTSQILYNENFKYGMSNMTTGRNYLTVDNENLFRNINSKETKTLYSLVSEGIENGEVRPLTRATFAAEEAGRAFLLQEETYHQGCVLIHVAEATISTVESNPVEKDTCYVIFCGSGSIGFQIVDKLKGNDINKFCIHIDGPYTGYLEYKKRVWEQQNIELIFTYGSLKKSDDVIEVLQNSTRLGIAKGILIVMDDFSKESVADMIDTESRNLCPHLKHFIILGRGMHVGRNTCTNRVDEGLQATFLDISMLNTTQTDANGNVLFNGVADAVEQAWQTSSTILQAVHTHTQERGLIQHVADLADLNLSDVKDNDASFIQLGVSPGKYLTISSFIQEMYNTYLDERDVGYMTIDKLTQIEDKSSNPLFEETKGLNTFFSEVGRDELLASLDIVSPDAMGLNFYMKDDEYNCNESYLFIIPGLEGLCGRFRTLLKSLKLVAYVLQPGLDHIDETPQQLAQRYSELLLKKLKIQNKFYIMGYETGVTAALELANILEKQGLNGTVFVLGEGPLEMKTLLESELNEYPTEHALQDALVIHFFKLFSCNEIENDDAYKIDFEAKVKELEKALLSCSVWGGRVSACVGSLLGAVAHSAQYMRAQLQAAYWRLQAARRAAPPACVLRARLVLLRARTPLHFTHHAHAHSLQRCSKQYLQAVNLDTPLPHIIRDLRVPVIINSFLDVDVLQTYENKSLCDGYYSKPHGIVKIT